VIAQCDRRLAEFADAHALAADVLFRFRRIGDELVLLADDARVEISLSLVDTREHQPRSQDLEGAAEGEALGLAVTEGDVGLRVDRRHADATADRLLERA